MNPPFEFKTCMEIYLVDQCKEFNSIFLSFGDSFKVCFCDHNDSQPNCASSNRKYSTRAGFSCSSCNGGGFDGGAISAYFDSPINATL